MCCKQFQYPIWYEGSSTLNLTSPQQIEPELHKKKVLNSTQILFSTERKNELDVFQSMFKSILLPAKLICKLLSKIIKHSFNSSHCTLLFVFSYSFGYYQWFLRQSDQYVPSWFALNVLIFHSLPRVKKGNDGKEHVPITPSKFYFAFEYLLKIFEMYIKRTVFVALSKELIVYFVPLLVLFIV